MIQEELVFGFRSKSAVNKEERGIGRVTVDWPGAEELKLSIRSIDIGARDGMVQLDNKSDVSLARPLDVE